MAKLPYIPNKKMYAAVMGACSYVRATGYFNKATQYYADKYGVSVDEVRRYVRMAASEGQKEKAEKSPRKYLYFAIEFSIGSERGGFDYFEKEYAQYTIRKATSPENAKYQLYKNDKDWSEYAPQHYFGRVAAFRTKEEAERTIEEWKKE